MIIRKTETQNWY